MSHDHSTGTDLHDRNGSHLEALLREDFEVLPDGGFTERVMASLPPRAASSRWRRHLVLGAAALLAALVGGFVLSGLKVPQLGPLLGEGSLHLLVQAFTWAPDGLPLPLPLVPMALGLIALGGSLLLCRSPTRD